LEQEVETVIQNVNGSNRNDFSKGNNDKTVTREFEPLISIKDHYPKYLVSMDTHFKDNIEGVRHIHLFDFLTSELEVMG
jgi:hypothetical protein